EPATIHKVSGRPETHMLREICEQPDAVRRALRTNASVARSIADEVVRRGVQVIVLAGRGTSDHAALYAQYLLQHLTGIPVALATASVYTLFGAPFHLRQALVIGISQSGESPDIVEVVRQSRQAGAFTVAVTNQRESPLAAAADETLFCAAGPEQSVAATKTYTTTCAVLALLAASLPGGERVLPHIQRLPDLMQAALATEDAVARAVVRYVHARDCIVLGRGFQYSTAREAALKLEETCYVIAMPFSSADFRHGPAALVERGLPVMLFAPPGKTAADSLALLGWLHERGADCIVMAEDSYLLEQATTAIALDLPRLEDVTDSSLRQGVDSEGVRVDELLAPLSYIVPGQFFAYFLAIEKGLDPDQPRGLSKVTYTR
ncbi:MAG TPA: SIS domain-containing protein, partial [Ktedonobacterales bacterium]|nr:SIS domain-containing protein [Ktedonobacterales bacterium]